MSSEIAPPREGQTFAGESLLVRYVNFVKLPHTVFALPFALLGVVVASREAVVSWRTVGLVALAFTAARFVAMGFNRIADRELDARNPRTRARELPAGRLSARCRHGSACLSRLRCSSGPRWALNPLCFALSPIALLVVTLYSYAKRFTWLVAPVARLRRCHRAGPRDTSPCRAGGAHRRGSCGSWRRR